MQSHKCRSVRQAPLQGEYVVRVSLLHAVWQGSDDRPSQHHVTKAWEGCRTSGVCKWEGGGWGGAVSQVVSINLQMTTVDP